MYDELLKRFGLKYEDLNRAERETLSSWYSALSKNELTMDKVRGHVTAIRIGIEQELAKPDNFKTQDIYLKARLRNIMLLEALLTSPERAKEALEQAIAGFTNLKPKG